MVHADVNRQRASQDGGKCRAFTLIELMASIGIVTILVGIVLPTLGDSMARARLTSDLSRLKQNVLLVDLYAQDHKDIYPVAHASSGWAARLWYQALQRNEYIRGPEEVDREAARHNVVTFILSKCMVYDPARMRSGWTVAVDQQAAAPIGRHQVTYPSEKGLMHKLYGWDGTTTHPYFCCVDPWLAPVAMADGSALLGTYLDFTGGRPVVVQDDIGHPIYSTWGGCRARDK